MTHLRRAKLTDIPHMLPLLDEYARQAEILPRTEDDLCRSIREWVIAEVDGTIAGMGALLILWHDLAEVRSLVIDPRYQGLGIGRKIVAQLVEDAETMGLPRVFALTRKPGFFLKIGFDLIAIEKLPRKVQRDCVFCPKFHRCDETAVITYLDASAAIEEPVAEVGKSAVNGHHTLNVIPLWHG